MQKKYLIYLFYCIFIFCAVFSLLYIPESRTYDVGSEISLLILFFPLGYMLWDRFGLRFFLITVVLLSLWALCIEYIGLVTGWPYSSFTYTGALGYKLFGILPWTVGLSWTPLMIGSVALVYCCTKNIIARILLPVAILVVFDGLLDPTAVEFGLWKYISGGPYYNVPIQNFVGWIFSGLVGSGICFFLFNNKNKKDFKGLWYSFFLSIVFWTLLAWSQTLVLPGLIGIMLVIFCSVIHFRSNEKISIQ